ncbi:hypothetical protein C1Y43_20140 [Pantoea sp. ICBG 828]|nr:hypothetical protein C1Y43_20140 [Pantoea sp. ICBG 828]
MALIAVYVWLRISIMFIYPLITVSFLSTANKVNCRAERLFWLLILFQSISLAGAQQQRS